MRNGIGPAAVVILLTALTYFVFPGHTYLQQDTQIYLPMLEKLRDGSLFSRELLTTHPHLSWTVYDETALAINRWTGLTLRNVLTFEQVLFRALGIWGVFLIGTSMGFTRRFSLFAAALFSLGAMIAGPQVLTIEYEPVPRGFAVPLVLCAVGLALHHRIVWSACAVSAALLYHPPTTAPFLAVYALLLWREKSWKPALIPAASMALLFALSRLQPGMDQRQPLLDTISPALQQLQQMRAAYNWVSLWTAKVIAHHAILSLVAALAMWRLRERTSAAHRIMLAGLLLVGILSVPAAYVTLELMHWSMIPQFQPARGILFATVLAVVLSALAAMQAASGGRYQEAFAWMLVPFIVPVQGLVLPPYSVPHALTILALTAASTAALAVHVRTPRRAAAAFAMTALAAFFAIPMLAGVRNYPALWNTEIRDLAQWARASTPRDAVFHFAGAGKDLSPGLFRSQALRAVYVDWKGGGQVNYFEDLAMEWWDRWQNTMLRPATDMELAARGVDYVVLRLPASRPGIAAVHSNARYVVYRIR